MNTKSETFSVLTEKDGYVSGEEIAKKLGVSRTAVWKAINSLRNDGIEISGATNKGYKLALSRREIYPFLIQLRTGIMTEYFKSLPSTNGYAKKIPDSKFPAVIIAEKQTDGKARFNEKFDSSRDGIYMSVCLREKIGTEYIRTVTECAVSSVKKIFGGEIEENTVVKNGIKKCGVLTEVECDCDVTEKIIVGIGIYTEPYEDKTSAAIEIISAVIKKVKSLAYRQSRLKN